LAASPESILQFWFGPPPLKRHEAWFHGGPAFDRACARFQGDWEEALAGGLLDWLDAPRTALAHIVLTDQFPRNLFREDGRAHATDHLARKTAFDVVARGWDKDMHDLERVFVYLPYEHSEDLAVQRESVRLYTELGLESNISYAQAHLDVIERFGRFPHRNVMLGRHSTPEELAFIAEKGRGW